MKKWLLRKQPEEKHDLRLWQTFRNIDLQTTIKLHEENPATKQATTPHSPRPEPNVAIVNSSKMASRQSSIGSAMYVRYRLLVNKQRIASIDSYHSMTFCFRFSLMYSLSRKDDVILMSSSNDNFGMDTSTDQMNNGQTLLHSNMHDTSRRVKDVERIMHTKTRYVLNMLLYYVDHS
jgi:hypothetical protein